MRRIVAGRGKLRNGVSYLSSNPPIITCSNSYSFSSNRNNCNLSSDSGSGARTVENVNYYLKDEDSKGSFDSTSKTKTSLSPEKDTRWLGLIRLDKEPGGTPHDQPYDEFAGDVEKIYRILRKFHSRVPKLELALQESGVVVRSGLTERVLNRCGDAGNLGYRRFASARMVKKAVEVLDAMPSYGCEPDEYVFGCLLDALCKNGSIREAALLFEDMRVRFPPTIKHFTSLLYGWCKEGKLMEAKFILVFFDMEKNGCEADVVTYTTLISGFCKRGKTKKGYELLDHMIQKGHKPNQTTYLHILNSHEKKDEFEECLELLNEMQKTGCYPDLNIYNTIIRLAFKLGEVKEGIRVWSQMEASGLSPGLDNFVNMIHGLIDQEWHVKDACSYCLDMMDAGLMPQPDTFAKLMKGLRKLYNRQIAAEITEKVRQMAAERNTTFKMYKRRGERDLKEKVKAKNDGRKRRARRRQWGSSKAGLI
ncbi:hypothetical protein E3N88_17478 [Mikania micrantha]|uniref:Pentacotripeptide-repeat region of PRORP domain-containing protein n=1 Tax=Mikania micrantha TaxID=192012 RepID=A0A5N6NRZ6_9ASTR|nr:hypothetical protein E3N88_17478 [Mikania micrantha]